jgi:hypothetical protein
MAPINTQASEDYKMTFDELITGLDELAQNLELEPVESNLDPRAGRLYSDPEKTMVATRNPRPLDYYGGFEYVEPEYRVKFGDWTVYSTDSKRVASAISDT